MIPCPNSKHYETILAQDWIQESEKFERESTTKMTLELIMFDHKYLKHKSLFFIYSNNMYMRYHQRKKLVKPIKFEKNQTWESKKKFNQLNDNDLREKRKQVIFGNSLYNHNAIVLYKIFPLQKHNYLYMRCSMTSFLNFVDRLRSSNSKIVTHDCFKEAQFWLEHLICF
jgi:hypothetical protein